MIWYCPKAPAYYNLQSYSFEVEGFRYLRAVQWLNQLRYTWHADQYSRQLLLVVSTDTWQTTKGVRVQRLREGLQNGGHRDPLVR